MSELDAVVDGLVRAYAAFLTASWDTVQERLRVHPMSELLDDWKQANWEILVEAQLWREGVFLRFYGEGAEIYPGTPRVTHSDARATHKVACRPLGDLPITDLLSGKAVVPEEGGWTLGELVTWREGWYFDEPPFTHVRTGENQDTKLFSLDHVRFFLAVASAEDQ